MVCSDSGGRVRPATVPDGKSEPQCVGFALVMKAGQAAHPVVSETLGLAFL
jgi:hypothetical protein